MAARLRLFEMRPCELQRWPKSLQPPLHEVRLRRIRDRVHLVAEYETADQQGFLHDFSCLCSEGEHFFPQTLFYIKYPAEHMLVVQLQDQEGDEGEAQERSAAT